MIKDDLGWPLNVAMSSLVVASSSSCRSFNFSNCTKIVLLLPLFLLRYKWHSKYKCLLSHIKSHQIQGGLCISFFWLCCSSNNNFQRILPCSYNLALRRLCYHCEMESPSHYFTVYTQMPTNDVARHIFFTADDEALLLWTAYLDSKRNLITWLLYKV